MTRGPNRVGASPGRVARLIFRFLLMAFPREIRKRFGEDMMDAFTDHHAAVGPGSWSTLGRFMARTAFSMVGNGLLERRRRWGRKVWVGHSPASPDRGRHETEPRRSTPMAEHFIRDLSWAIRMLRRKPLFTLAALVTLALGVGATTSIFSVVHGVLLTPLPFQEPDRLVTIYPVFAGEPDEVGTMSKPDLRDFQDLAAFDAVVGYRGTREVITGLGNAKLVSGTLVTSGMLPAFGLQPFMGRDLRFEESFSGHELTVVISHAFWQGELAGDPEVVGRSLEIQGQRHQIVGVAPPGFDYPQGAQFWRPLVWDYDGCGRSCHVYDIVARLAAATTLLQARDQATVLGAQLEETYPDSNLDKGFRVISLEELTVGDMRVKLWVLLGSVGFVLLVACANVANLLLARAQDRVQEIGLRAALGASRAHLALQVLTESLVLSVVGGAVGLGLAFGGVALLRRMAEGTVPRIEDVAVNGPVMLFTLTLVLLVTCLFGMVPAVRLARSSPATAIGRSRSRGVVGREGRRSRNFLLGAEMALSVLLLVGAGLLLRTLGKLNQVPLGYQTQDILTFDLVLPSASYPELSQVTGFFAEVESRIGAMPGVASVGSAYGVPLVGGGLTGWIWVDGRPRPEPEEETHATLRSVRPTFFETMGIRILRGRGIEATDDAGSLPVAVVNETFARQNFPNQDPIGERFDIYAAFRYGNPTYTIVGVVPDLRSNSLAGAPVPEVYAAHEQVGPGQLTIAVRSEPGVAVPLQAIRSEIQRMDADVPLRDVSTMTQWVAKETASTRLFLILLTLFSTMAVTLAATGLYGVIAYLIARRKQEIGIRLALGADGMGVVGLVLAQAASPTLLGLAAGLAGALAGGRVMESFLFQVEPRDPAVYAGVATVLLVVALLAVLFPAYQASRIDPVRALDGE